MSTETAARAGAGRSRWLVTVAVVAAAGVFAGMRWHSTLERWLVPSAGVTRPASSDHDAASPSRAVTQLWTCGMHPQVIQDHPGDCPICHMKLTPLTPGVVGASAGGGTVLIDPAVVQNMGVRTVRVSRGVLTRRVRAMANLVEPESSRTEINLRVSGWIERLYADTDGMTVRKGDPLLELYSPELRQAIEELISARRAVASSDAGQLRETLEALAAASASRLETLGLSPEQVSHLGGMDHAPATISINSPIDGIVIEKANVYRGSGVTAGQMLFRLADRSTMWAEARVPEGMLGSVRVDQRATIRLEPSNLGTATGRIVFIHPNLDGVTRTATVRVALPNPDGILRAGMFAIAEFETGSGEPVTILPREAILDTGETRIVFVRGEKGHFEPRRVSLGASGDDGLVEVLAGVSPGEDVVASGQFLIDSESRLREAIAKFLSGGDVTASPARPGQSRATDPSSRESPTAPIPPSMPGKDAKAPPELVDKVVAEYLAIAEPFGRESPDTPPADVDALLLAIDALSAGSEGADAARMISTAREAVRAMKSRAIEQQREGFKAVSAAVIAIVDSMPPSRETMADLYIANCPMAKADWLQRGEKLANPFYAEDMAECGVIVRRIGRTPGAEGER